MFKLLRYWWNYNAKSKEPSFLFWVVSILLMPFIVAWVWYHIASEAHEDAVKRRKEFWDGYKNYKQKG